VNVAIHVNERNISIDLSNVMAPQLDVMLIAYVREASTVIPRGENAGRTLQEFNIVRDIKHFNTTDNETMQFNVPRSALPSDATHIAVLVQRPNQGVMLAATSTALFAEVPSTLKFDATDPRRANSTPR
jgi:hypothetical protein